MLHRTLLAAAWLLLPTYTSMAGDLPVELRSLLESRCLSCHNDTDREGQFSLQTAASLFDSGYVVPGDLDNSELIQVLLPQHGDAPRMPKDGRPLSETEVRILQDWVEAGADWSNESGLTMPRVVDFDWWSWKPLVRPAVPELDQSTRAWVQTPVDAFVRHRQLSIGLKHAPKASRRTLIRRVTFDLTGLPPQQHQVREFLEDRSESAWQRLVDRLLQSEAYGERWGRHWLDVVKYADTHGYDKDKLRPNAWPYRDYVIRSFNQDKPWRQFIEEQIAGDALYPDSADGILGLGFLAAGPWDFIGHVEVPESKLDGKVARNLDRDDMVSNVLNSFCSVTVQCARCHNHKFDPITQEQYYGLQAVFAAVDRAERVYDVDSDTERQRHELTDRVATLRAALLSHDKQIQARGGEQLRALEAEVKSLEAVANPLLKPAEFGYHSQIENNSTAAKWVEVDLGREAVLQEIILHPCHDDFADIGAGFGFPRQLIVTCRAGRGDTSITLTPAAATQQQDGAALSQHSLTALRFPCGPQPVRFIRVTATELAERKNDYIFALAELQAVDPDGNNLAKHAAVQALDSIQAPPRWSTRNLTDGRWPAFQDDTVAQRLTNARKERNELLDSLVTESDKQRRSSITADIAATEAQIRTLPPGRLVYAAATHFQPQGNFKPTNASPRDVRILRRGEVSQPQELAIPGSIPLSDDDSWQFDLPETATESDRRIALARWVASDQNPLTWRSMANRIWQYHFGRGLVDSPNDFGRMGQQPSHPELLDWLACELRRTQSVKHLHRLILNSATWQQAVVDDAMNAAVDGDNRFLWRMNRRRLTAEEIRDSVLSVSKCLNLEAGGPGFYLFELEKTDHSPHYEYHKFDPDDTATHRRSVYRFVVRSQPDPFMTTLDCADSSQSTPRRLETQTALQSLSLLNNSFMLTMAEHLAARLEEHSSDHTQQVRLAIRDAFCREATPEEVELLARFAAKHGLKSLCRGLFNMNEFIFVD
jgi:hypothetical protein